MLQQLDTRADFSDYGSVAASVVDQLPVEEILRHHARKATLERLKSNGVNHEDDLVDLTEGQLEYMGIGVIERRKVLARTDSLRRRRRKIDHVRERIPKDSCLNSHKRASQLFIDFTATPQTAKVSRLRYSTYGPLLDPLMKPDEVKDVVDKVLTAENLHQSHVQSLSESSGQPTARPRKIFLKKESDKYLDTKSLDSIGGEGLTDVESILTFDDQIPKNASILDKDSGTDCTSSPANPSEILVHLKQSSQKSLFESNRFSTAAPMTPQHVACSLRLMAIWHAHFVIEVNASETGIDVKTLRILVRLVSKMSGEKSPTNILNEVDRASNASNGGHIHFAQFQSLLVNKYSHEPLAIDVNEMENVIWNEYYCNYISRDISEIGISSTVALILWQVFNRMADEQYYPPSMPKVDLMKILSKCAKFFNRLSHNDHPVINQEEVFQFPKFLCIMWNEAKNEQMDNGSDASLELAKELHNIFVIEELRAGPLQKRANNITWHKRYFTVVPFELRWYSNGEKTGKPKCIPLNENTHITYKDNKIQITNGQKTIKLKGKDAKSTSTWRKAIELVNRVHSTCLTPRQTQLLERRHGEHSLEVTQKSNAPIVHV